MRHSFKVCKLLHKLDAAGHCVEMVQQHGLASALAAVTYPPVQKALGLYSLIKNLDENGLSALAGVQSAPVQDALEVYNFLKTVEAEGLAKAMAGVNYPPFDKAMARCIIS